MNHMLLSILLFLNHLTENFHAYTLWSFDGETECSIPDELGHTSDCATYTEDDGVVGEILKTEIVE